MMAAAQFVQQVRKKILLKNCKYYKIVCVPLADEESDEETVEVTHGNNLILNVC